MNRRVRLTVRLGDGLTDVRTGLQENAQAPDMMRFCITGAQGAARRLVGATDASSHGESEDGNGLKALKTLAQDDISDRGIENGVATTDACHAVGKTLLCAMPDGTAAWRCFTRR